MRHSRQRHTSVRNMPVFAYRGSCVCRNKPARVFWLVNQRGWLLKVLDFDTYFDIDFSTDSNIDFMPNSVTGLNAPSRNPPGTSPRTRSPTPGPLPELHRDPLPGLACHLGARVRYRLPSFKAQKHLLFTVWPAEMYGTCDVTFFGFWPYKLFISAGKLTFLLKPAQQPKKQGQLDLVQLNFQRSAPSFLPD